MKWHLNSRMGPQIYLGLSQKYFVSKYLFPNSLDSNAQCPLPKPSPGEKHGLVVFTVFPYAGVIKVLLLNCVRVRCMLVSFKAMFEGYFKTVTSGDVTVYVGLFSAAVNRLQGCTGGGGEVALFLCWV